MATQTQYKDKDPSGKGRRRVPRRPIQDKVGLLVSGQYSICWAYEIGEGGILIETEAPLQKDQKVVVTIRIAGSLNAVLIGQVVYVNEPQPGQKAKRYGLQFEEVDFETRRKIRNFVASGTKYVLNASGT